MKFLQGVLKANLPKKSVKVVVDSVLDNIHSLIKKNKIEAQAILGGSYAKNNHLKEGRDITPIPFECGI